MNNPFSIPGWNVTEIKNPNGTRELFGYKQKNTLKDTNTFFKVLLKVLLILLLLAFIVLVITNKQSHIKNYVTNVASNFISPSKSSSIETKNRNFINEKNITINKTVEEEKSRNFKTNNNAKQKAMQPEEMPFEIKDYSNTKPWEAFNIIKAELKTTENKIVLDSLFNYLVTFSITAKNQRLSLVWKNKSGSDKTISELFSYVVNSAGTPLKCYTVKNEGRYWNEITFSGTTIIYDIPNKKITYNISDYQNGYKY